MNFISYARLIADCNLLASQIQGRFDLILGVPRSGMLAATMVGLRVNIPVMDVDSFVMGRTYNFGARIKLPEEMKNILVIDDSVGEGVTMEKLHSLQFPKGPEYKFATIYMSPAKKNSVDYFVRLVERPRMFQWNIFHCRRMRFCGTDIDGVLCRDPSALENDDGQNYRQFIMHVKPLFRPTEIIGVIITNRLEKYRRLTEIWFAKYKIKYKHLYMSSHRSKKERQKAKDYAVSKARALKKSKAVLYIESSAKLAAQIAQFVKIPIVCTENWKIYKSK